MAGTEERAAGARGERVYLRVADTRWARAEPSILREEVAWDAQ
jgi:hypothetical protein